MSRGGYNEEKMGIGGADNGEAGSVDDGESLGSSRASGTGARKRRAPGARMARRRCVSVTRIGTDENKQEHIGAIREDMDDRGTGN